MSSKIAPKILFVIGCGRSGTSALTRVLNLAGADLSHDCIPPDEKKNRKGFWEAREVLAVNDALLASAGTPMVADGSYWHDFQNLDHLWDRNSDRWDSLVRQAMSCLQPHVAARYYVVKDPRINQTLPIWSEAARQVGGQPYFILSLRHPAECAASYALQHDYAPSRGLLIWWRNTLQALKHTRELPLAVVAFNRLLAEKAAVVCRIGHRLGFDLGHDLSSERQQEIDGFLDDRERQCREGKIDIETPPALLRLYQALQEMETRDGRPEGFDSLIAQSEVDLENYLAREFHLIDDHRIAAERSHAEQQAPLRLLEAAAEENRAAYEAELRRRRRITGSFSWRLLAPLFRLEAHLRGK